MNCPSYALPRCHCNACARYVTPCSLASSNRNRAYACAPKSPPPPPLTPSPLLTPIPLLTLLLTLLVGPPPPPPPLLDVIIPRVRPVCSCVRVFDATRRDVCRAPRRDRSNSHTHTHTHTLSRHTGRSKGVPPPRFLVHDSSHRPYSFTTQEDPKGHAQVLKSAVAS